MKFKVGDRVRIKKDLEVGRYGKNTVTCEMLQYRGNETTIKDTCLLGYALLDCGWTWTDEMLELIERKIIVGIKHISVDGLITNDITYNFKCTIPVIVGDYVLCETQFGLALGVVTDCNSDYPATKYIISKVDLSSYQEILNKENKKKELKDKMDKIYKEADKLHPLNPLYYLYANINEEMAKLIKEYEELK